MSETLGQKQRAFTIDVANLIVFAYQLGYELTFGEATRSDEQAEINAMGQRAREGVAVMLGEVYRDLAAALRNNGKAGGIRNSLHQQRIAIDLNLFKDGVYLTDSAVYSPLGEFWKSLREGNRWGGDFSRPDGNHFSREHNGVQ